MIREPVKNNGYSMVRLTIRVDPPFILAYFVFHKGEFWTNFSQNAYGQARRGWPDHKIPVFYGSHKGHVARIPAQIFSLDPLLQKGIESTS